MKRRSLPVAAALVASAALLLTACGGDDSGSKDNDKIAGADTGSETSASPTASASASAASVDRPKIELPSDLAYTFTPEQTGDAVKDAVLEDNAEMIALSTQPSSPRTLGFRPWSSTQKPKVPWPPSSG